MRFNPFFVPPQRAAQSVICIYCQLAKCGKRLKGWEENKNVVDEEEGWYSAGDNTRARTNEEEKIEIRKCSERQKKVFIFN